MYGKSSALVNLHEFVITLSRITLHVIIVLSVGLFLVLMLLFPFFRLLSLFFCVCLFQQKEKNFMCNAKQCKSGKILRTHS